MSTIIEKLKQINEKIYKQKAHVCGVVEKQVRLRLRQHSSYEQYQFLKLSLTGR